MARNHVKSVTVRALLFPDGISDEGKPMWSIQCLDVDVAAQGKTIDEAEKNLLTAIVGQLVIDVEAKSKTLFSVTMAPQSYWDRFSFGREVASRFIEPIPGSVSSVIGFHSVRIQEIRIEA